MGESIEDIRAEQATHGDVDRRQGSRLLRDLVTGRQEAALADVEQAVEQYPELARALRSSEEEQRFYAELFEEFKRRLTAEGKESAKAHFMEQISARFRHRPVEDS